MSNPKSSQQPPKQPQPQENWPTKNGTDNKSGGGRDNNPPKKP